MKTGEEILKEENAKADKQINTGYSELDRKVKPLKEGELTLLLGRPAMGKTMIALNIAGKLINSGKEVCYISFETDKKHLVEKLLNTKQLFEEQLKRFYVSDTPYTSLRAREMVESIKNNCPNAKLIVIDCIQFIGTDLIQWLYKEFPNAAVLILSQASRKIEERENHHVNLEDIENIDVLSPYLGTIVSIYREDYYSFEEEPVNIMQVINLRTRQMGSLVQDEYSLTEDNQNKHLI